MSFDMPGQSEHDSSGFGFLCPQVTIVEKAQHLLTKFRGDQHLFINE